MNKGVVIVDYGMGNIFSIGKVVAGLGFPYRISNASQDILEAEKIILPGVGHFGTAMDHLRSTGLIDSLHEAVLIKKVPVLGICLGMQLMAGFSEEGDTSGLGWFDARVKRFQIKNPALFKVPHMGWNTVINHQPSAAVMKNLPEEAAFYFVHSYHIDVKNPADILTTTMYESTFVSSICRDNITGVQFHPEKSHLMGKQLIKNFLTQ